MSLPRPHGLYLVQFIGYGESGSLGDLYATRKGHRQSVGLDPNTPEFHGQQVLLVEPASREDPDVHAISFAPEESWSYKSENPVPGEPIVLGRPKGFRMQRSERSQGRHIFTSIAPEEQPTGATLYVGAGEHQRELTLVPITAVPDAPPAPLWELKPLDLYKLNKPYKFDKIILCPLVLVGHETQTGEGWGTPAAAKQQGWTGGARQRDGGWDKSDTQRRAAALGLYEAKRRRRSDASRHGMKWSSRDSLHAPAKSLFCNSAGFVAKRPTEIT
ncbi:hypothetical protein RHS03_04358, partial [Rhizoctonia solani]